MGRGHVMPRFDDRWSYLYLEHCRLEQDAASLALHEEEGVSQVPINQLGLLLLGPGTSVTHAAMKTLMDNASLVCWTGEGGARLYAHGASGNRSSRRLLRQAQLFCDEESRIQVIRRMDQKRFPEPLPPDTTLEQIRGMEGARVRATYQQMSRKYGVAWERRAYDPGNWDYADPVNRALSAANALLYGVCHAAILSAAYSPAIGFIHTGKMLSFVYDVADFYKTEVAVPAAFGAVAEGTEEVERRTRLRCRDVFYESKLLDRILPDIAEVLHVGDVAGELPDELEGRIITLADRTEERRVSGEPERPSSG